MIMRILWVYLYITTIATALTYVACIAAARADKIRERTNWQLLPQELPKPPHRRRHSVTIQPPKPNGYRQDTGLVRHTWINHGAQN